MYNVHIYVAMVTTGFIYLYTQAHMHVQCIYMYMYIVHVRIYIGVHKRSAIGVTWALPVLLVILLALAVCYTHCTYIYDV